MKIVTRTVIMALALFWTAAAFSWEPNEVLSDPALETRAREISSQLRCLVCQNQSIDGSDADLAKDLRLLVSERLKAGDTNDEVFAFMVDRYGEFILLKPKFGLKTVLLWGLPGLLPLIGGGIIFYSLARRKKTKLEIKDLSTVDKARISEIIDGR
jgi:cytochrome c-type biogenesis protein CcmH